LIEGLPFYQDKLHEEAVFNQFTEILAKVSDSALLTGPYSWFIDCVCYLRLGATSRRTNLIQS
jgi:hypothetical protein